MLVFESDLPGNARKRLALLQEARRVYESGIKLSTFTGERAKLDRDLGTCLVLLAALANSPAEKLTLYDEAIGYFELDHERGEAVKAYELRRCVRTGKSRLSNPGSWRMTTSCCARRSNDWVRLWKGTQRTLRRATIWSAPTHCLTTQSAPCAICKSAWKTTIPSGRITTRQCTTPIWTLFELLPSITISFGKSLPYHPSYRPEYRTKGP